MEPLDLYLCWRMCKRKLGKKQEVKGSTHNMQWVLLFTFYLLPKRCKYTKKKRKIKMDFLL